MSAPRGDRTTSGPTIGYYVHHHGRGHLHRAGAVARALARRHGCTVTGLSSFPRPAEWSGDWAGGWVELAPDDDPSPLLPTDHGDVTAGGRLHWVPRDHAGLLRRTTQLSAWLEAARPAAVVVDVSVEVSLLVRLHGVPVVGVVLPGERTDAPHRLALDTADALVGCWPDEVTDAMLPGLPADVRARVHGVGGLSRHPVDDVPPPGGRRGRTVLYLGGAGGHDLGDAELDARLAAAQAQTPTWTWQVADARRWRPDTRTLLQSADVVVTHTGQNAVAEVAAARRPAVLVPQRRPHDEQAATARVLADGTWPAVVESELPAEGWAERLERCAAIDAAGWARWCDGGSADRFADVVAGVARVAAPAGAGSVLERSAS